jgi:nicotinamidase/pyrazinamidase
MTHSLLFWDVDTQLDFMLPGGKLYVPGAEQIIANLARLTRYAQQRRIPVLSSADTHQPKDPEFEQYPPHCIAGTPGQQKLPETLLPNRLVVPNAPFQWPDDLRGYEQFIIEKPTLDVFTNQNVDTLLNRLAPREIVLYGVVTEICVWLAARELLARGHCVRLVDDAMCAFNKEKGRECLKELVHNGAALMSTSEITDVAQPQSA